MHTGGLFGMLARARSGPSGCVRLQIVTSWKGHAALMELRNLLFHSLLEEEETLLLARTPVPGDRLESTSRKRQKKMTRTGRPDVQRREKKEDGVMKIPFLALLSFSPSPSLRSSTERQFKDPSSGTS